jgi:threonine/homoserine/homoserine lactone efflux protein
MATLLLAMTPGQDFIYVMIRSISQGARAGIVAIAGLMVGVTLHTFAAATGVAAILLTSSYAFTAVKLIGAAYLIYLGVQSFRQRGNLDIQKSRDKASNLKLFKEGILSSTLNPKLALFFMAFLPQFVASGAEPFTQMLLLGLLFALLSLPILIAVAVLSAKFGNIITGNELVAKLIGKITGIVLVGLGIRLAMVER